MFRSSRTGQSEPKAAANRRRIWIVPVLLIVMSALSVAIVLGIQNQEDAIRVPITRRSASVCVICATLARTETSCNTETRMPFLPVVPSQIFCSLPGTN